MMMLGVAVRVRLHQTKRSEFMCAYTCRGFQNKLVDWKCFSWTLCELILCVGCDGDRAITANKHRTFPMVFPMSTIPT